MSSEDSTPEMLAEAEVTLDVDIADGYCITTVRPSVDHPPKIKTYTIPPQDLQEFFATYRDTGEILLAVRPIERGANA